MKLSGLSTCIPSVFWNAEKTCRSKVIRPSTIEMLSSFLAYAGGTQTQRTFGLQNKAYQPGGRLPGFLLNIGSYLKNTYKQIYVVSLSGLEC